ncbi:hypothetical protein CGCSCA5_v007872 [Colletotrichum siamense]|nr:hypothetical protein CGCSCA5_v007872 [Colletotrichum siamense]KAF4874452.1 hypothetical protein CGCSCA1_v006424 [Colletotrichum siamense]
MNHRAWPTDISELGENLLHRACYIFASSRRPRNRAHLYAQTLAALVSMGVPVNESAESGTPLRLFLSEREFNGGPRILERRSDYADHVQFTAFIARELSSRGAIYSEFGEKWYFSWVLPGLFPFLGDIWEGFEYGELSSALIRRSKSDVRRLLGQSVEYIFERGHGQQTPLHVATWWPQGLEILFELANEACVSILHATDDLGLTPLQYAISWPQPKSVALLLKENATLDFEDSSAYSPGNFAGDLRQHNKEVCRLLVAALLDRRTKMLQYALEHLPESEVVRFDLRNRSFLNGIAFEVGESIKLHTTRLPEIFKDVRPGLASMTSIRVGMDARHS